MKKKNNETSIEMIRTCFNWKSTKPLLKQFQNHTRQKVHNLYQPMMRIHVN